jgi:hypothetical protein
MKMKTFYSIILIVLLLYSCKHMAIEDISPKAGLPGTVVEIKGKGFAANPLNNAVTIGGIPARVISGDTNHLRVVALRDFISGPIVVTNGSNNVTSVEEFKREGSTTRATPLQDSDAELIEGVGYDVDKRYDMSAQGLNQKILVVLATPSDIDPEDLAPAGKTAREAIIDKLGPVNEYFIQASYNKVSADFTVTPDWITLSQIRDFYCWQQDDIDRAEADVDAAQAALDTLKLDPDATEEQITEAEEELKEAEEKHRAAKDAKNKLQEPDFLFAEALLGAKAADPNFDQYSDYLVIVAGPFLRGRCCWKETGFHAESTRLGLKFDIDFPSPKGLTYVSQGAAWDRITHELSHFFAGGDLYSWGFADGSFLEGNAAPFAMMGNHGEEPLYIGYNIEKHLDYFAGGPDGNIKILEWGSTADFDEKFDLVAHAKTEDPTGDNVFHLLKLRVTEGLFYYVEVRQRPDPSLGAAADYVFDPSIPFGAASPSWLGGVIVYKAVENNNQSNNNERKVSLLPPGRMFQVGDSFHDPARTIRITVSQKLTNRPAKYRVGVEWGHLPAANPDGQFDLRITPWSPPPWESPDIWANSIKNDETSPTKIIYKNHEQGDDTKPIGNGDPPWVKHDNTLFARITNQGAVDTPEPVKVSFYVITPPGMGDNGTWAPFDEVDLGIMTAGETKIAETNNKWRPSVGEHTCVKVEIHKQTGEVTFDNNRAQENFLEFETGAASPYTPIEFDFIARNPYDAPLVMGIQAHNVPEAWFVALNHGSVWLPPRGEKKVHAVIWTDRVAEWSNDKTDKAPRKPIINLEGWMDRWGDQHFAVGGITVFAQAVRKVDIQIELRSNKAKVGGSFSFGGNIIPNTGIAPIAVHIIDPNNERISEITATSNTGRIIYTTKYKATVPGKYLFQVFVLGGSLAGEAESGIFEINVQ